MSNIILFPQLNPFQPRPASFAISEHEKKIAGLEQSTEQLRAHMAVVTNYLEKLQLHLTAESDGTAEPLEVKPKSATSPLVNRAISLVSE